MKSYLTLTLLFSFSLGYTQAITGKILDSEKKPLVYATIQITDDYGVLTNEEGQFSIEIDRFKENDSVTISYLGYKKVKLELKDFQSTDYYLEADVNVLDEVVLFNKNLSVKEILEKVRENALSNYETNNLKQQIFHRTTFKNKYRSFDFNFEKSNLVKKIELAKLNKSMDSLVKESINSSSTNYEDILSELSLSGEDSKINVIKATLLINKNKDRSEDKMQELFLKTVSKYLEKDETYKVKSGLFKVEDSLNVETDFKEDNLYKSASLRSIYNETISDYTIHEKSKLDFIYKYRKYEYELKGASYLLDDLVYKIDFIPKSNAAKYEGTIYVNADNFAVVKANFRFAKGKIGRKLNLKLLMGVKMFENHSLSEVLFQKNINGKYQLRFIKQEEGASIYLDRPLKFTSNKKNKDDKEKTLKINFLLDFDQFEKDELFFIETVPISKAEYAAFKEKEKFTLEHISKYTPTIWQGYNVINPIQAIKNYDTGEKN